MNAAIVMIILTALPDGGVSSSFVNVDTLQSCETRLQRIRPVLETGKVELKLAGCFRSDLRFDYFDHDRPADAARFSFLVEVKNDAADISKFDDPLACEHAMAQKRLRQDHQAWCATSTQDFTSVDTR